MEPTAAAIEHGCAAPGSAPRPGNVIRVTDSPHDPQPDRPTDRTTDATTDRAPRPAPDLDRIERDLAAVEAALPRLDDGSYWVDEATGEEIPDEVHVVDPVARRA